MSDRFIIANSSLLGLPAGLVAKMLRFPVCAYVARPEACQHHAKPSESQRRKSPFRRSNYRCKCLRKKELCHLSRRCTGAYNWDGGSGKSKRDSRHQLDGRAGNRASTSLVGLAIHHYRGRAGSNKAPSGADIGPARTQGVGTGSTGKDRLHEWALAGAEPDDALRVVPRRDRTALL